HFQLCFVELDLRRRAIVDLRDSEAPLVEPLVIQADPRPIEEQDLHRVLPFSVEHKHRTASRIVAQMLTSYSRKPIESTAHVDRLRCQKDLNTRGDHSTASRARTTSTNSA